MFKIDSTTGTWSLKSGDEELTNCVISVNHENLLKNADVSKTGNGFRATRTNDGFEVEITFSNAKDGWNRVDLSLKNVSHDPRYVSRIFWFSQPMSSCFKSTEGKLRFFGENCRWIDVPGDVVNTTSRMVGSLSRGPSDNAWIAGFAPPQFWASSVDMYVNPAKPESGVFSAFVDQGPAPLRIDPGEEFVFDTLVLSCERPILEGFQAFGKLFSPKTPATETKAHAGYNTWEYYREGITAKTCLQDLEALASNEKTRDKIRYFILDHGWQKACGDWVFDVEKFGMDAEEWCRRVEEKGMIPGLWTAPFLAEDSVIRKLGAEPLNVGWNKTFVLDPSDPVVIDHVCGQIKNLAAAGFKYFKTDFLSQANKLGMRPYKHGNRTGEAVFRHFFKRLREAIGDDAFWLACGTDIASCAGVVDAARIATDVKANWNLLKQRLLPTIMGRFWMHGNLWINDADFLLLKGDHLKPGCPHTLNDNNRIPYQGLSHDEAILWAATLVITGSLVTWSDSPGVIDANGVDIVSRCVDHCGGPSGVPLDFGEKPLPERWVKRDDGKLYVAFFNFEDEEKTLSLSSDDAPELADVGLFKDIFSDEECHLSGGALECRLRPRSAACLLNVD